MCKGWNWDASHYDDIAVRLNLGGGAIHWYRKLHSSGRKRWHKIVVHPDGSPEEHWLTERDHLFVEWMRSVDAKAIPVGEGSFADQELYDELAERSEQNRAIIKQHRDRLREEAAEEDESV
jgi:hypothetical protein